MIDLTRNDPTITLTDKKVTLIGCGAVGAPIAEILVRMGLENIEIWDPDEVESHNIMNQLYTFRDIGKDKVGCLMQILKNINPEVKVITHKQYYKMEDAIKESDIVIMCVDTMKARMEIVGTLKYSSAPLCIDTRMGFTEGSVFAAENKDFDWLNDTISYTDDDPDLQNRPVNACKQPLAITIAPRLLANIAVTEVIKFVKDEFKTGVTICDSYKPNICKVIVK